MQFALAETNVLVLPVTDWFCNSLHHSWGLPDMRLKWTWPTQASAATALAVLPIGGGGGGGCSCGGGL